MEPSITPPCDFENERVRFQVDRALEKIFDTLVEEDISVTSPHYLTHLFDQHGLKICLKEYPHASEKRT